MAGLAVLYQANSKIEERESAFQSLLRDTARLKQLEAPASLAVGRFCTGAKLDSPASLHRGFMQDTQTGSWILAVGKVVALHGNNTPATLLGDLLHGYLERGVGVMDDYDGHFAIVIYNAREDAMTIISDPMGLFAFYYARVGGKVLVSTSAMALARQVQSPKADALAMEVLLRTGRIYGEHTIWEDVKRVLPGRVMKFGPRGMEEVEYWRPTVDPAISRMRMADAMDHAKGMIINTLQKALSYEGEIWADLTGGFDSRFVSMFLEKAGIPFTSYCVGPSGHPDIEVSRLVCMELGWKYRQFQIPEDWTERQFGYLDAALGKGDGLLNMFQLATVIQIGEERSKTAFASVSGSGVDEWRYHIFGGGVVLPGAMSKLNFDSMMNTRIVEPIPLYAMRTDRTQESRDAIVGHIRRTLVPYQDAPKITQMDISFLRYRHPIHAGTFVSAMTGIMRPLVPFCFKAHENFALSMNHMWRIKYDFRFVRTLMERENPRLASIRVARGEPAGPIRLTNLHKYAPLWKFLANLYSMRITQKVTGKAKPIFPVTMPPNYPLPEWAMAYLRWAEDQKLVDPARMCSGALYNPEGLRARMERALAGNLGTGEFLERVITMEIAVRETGASVREP